MSAWRAEMSARRAQGDGTLTTSVTRDVSEAKRCFVAHDLRGSITPQRTLAEVMLADPNADTAALREMSEGVVAACERQERLLEALLTLAQSERGRLRREPVDLAATAAEVLRAQDHHGLGSTTALEPAPTTGDPQLVERLVANLVTNAIRHNIPFGRVGLGLAIVQAIANAHDATVTAQARTGGGLGIAIAFPALD
jgi:signal transduction histidine kinase